MPSAYKINPEELGFIPLVAAAAPAVLDTAGKLGGGIIKGIGGLFKKKHHGGAPAPAAKAAPATHAAASSPAAHALSESASPAHHKKHKAAASSDLAGVPASVKADVLSSLQKFSNQKDAGKHAHRELVKKLAAVVKPSIDKMKADVTTAALQRKVTSEHNKIVKEDDRWKTNQDNQAAILAKIDELEKALTANQSGTKRAFRIYGVNVS